MKKTILSVAILIFVLVALIALLSSPLFFPGRASGGWGATGNLELAEVRVEAFDQVPMDASYEDVVALLGQEGTLLTLPEMLPSPVANDPYYANRMKEDGGEIYAWKNRHGQMMLVVFEDGVVVGTHRPAVPAEEQVKD